MLFVFFLFYIVIFDESNRRKEEDRKKENTKRVESFFGQRRPCLDDICSALELLFFTTSRLITYSKRVCAVFCIFLLLWFSLFFWITKSYVLYVLLKQKKGRRKSGRFDWSLSVVYRSSFNLWLLSTSRTYYSYNICSGLGTILRLLPFSCIHSRMRGKM